MVVKEKEYLQIFDNIVSQKGNATLINKRHNKTLFYFGKAYTLKKKKTPNLLPKENELTNMEVGRFFMLVSKFVNEYIIRNDFEITDIKRETYNFRVRNNKAFDSLQTGEYFWCFDVNNAYWQMMYKLGIISENVYNKYAYNNKYKLIKKIAIGLTVSGQTARFLQNGEVLKSKDGKELIVYEDKTLWKRVYKNVRHMTYNIPVDVINKIGADNYIFYNQDAVAVKNEFKKDADDFFLDNGIDYKKILCRKISDSEYMFGSEKRTFLSRTF